MCALASQLVRRWSVWGTHKRNTTQHNTTQHNSTLVVQERRATDSSSPTNPTKRDRGQKKKCKQTRGTKTHSITNMHTSTSKHKEQDDDEEEESSPISLCSSLALLLLPLLLHLFLVVHQCFALGSRNIIPPSVVYKSINR